MHINERVAPSYKEEIIILIHCYISVIDFYKDQQLVLSQKYYLQKISPC